jgi:hypothetical protein
MAKKKSKGTAQCSSREPRPQLTVIPGHTCYALEDLAHLDRIRRELFEADAARLHDSIGKGEDVVTDAFVYWIGYPLYLDLIGHDWRGNSTRKAAYHALNYAHAQATEVMMREAIKHGLDPHPLYECARVVREVYANSPEKYYCPDSCNTWPEYKWPECMGEARYSLPPGQQEALRDGEAVLVRLAFKCDVHESEDINGIVRKVHPEQRLHFNDPSGHPGEEPERAGTKVKSDGRRSLTRDDEAKVLVKCRRRCCVCFGLDGDASEKKGQLAHLDQNRSNNTMDNFVYLCFHHHDTYDSKTSQSKNLTEHEVRSYQAKLHQAVEQGEVPRRR